MAESIRNINGGRILWCCDHYGIPVDELASSFGLKEDVLARIRQGKKLDLPLGKFEQLAKGLGYSLLFFLDSSPIVEQSICSAHFRTLNNQETDLSKQVKQLIQRVEKKRGSYLGLLNDLGERPNRQWLDIKSQLTGSPSKRGNQLYQALGLSNQINFQTLRQAVEQIGILVFTASGYRGTEFELNDKDGIAGFNLYYENCPVVVIKSSGENKERQNFTLAHELGHLFLDHESQIDKNIDLLYGYQGKEAAANQFAGHLLVPDYKLQQIDAIPDAPTEYKAKFQEYSKNWGVNPIVIIRRLLDSKRITQNDYEAYVESSKPVATRDGGNRKYRHREPVQRYGKPLVGTVLNAYHAGLISLSKASDYLDRLNIPGVKKLDGEYASL